MPYPALDAYHIENPDRIYSPGLILFKSLLEHNLDEMVRVAGSPDRLRPHCKTHKIPQIIQMWLDRGVNQHKCATLAEAEMLALCGVKDVLIAYQMVGPNLDRFIRLLELFPDVAFSTLVDSPTAVRLLADAISSSIQSGQLRENATSGVLMDLNSGMDRTGIAIGNQAIELYEMIDAEDVLRTGGLHWYDGHHRQDDLQQRRVAVETGWGQLTKFRDQVMLSGLRVPKVVAAGTGSFSILAENGEPGLELSPGTTVFHDDDMVTRFPEQNFIPAQAILTRVISCSQPGFLTLDVGHKSCAADQPAGRRLFFPQLGSFEEVMQSEEHLVVRTPQAPEFRLGDALVAIPRHACPVSAVHQFANVIEGGKCIDCWQVTARDRVISI